MALRKPLVLAPGSREIAAGDGLIVPGHLSGVGGSAPTVSTGTLVAGSTDLRGSVTLGAGATTVTVTFGSACAIVPFVTASSSLALGVGVGTPSKTAFTLTSASGIAGQTLTWVTME